METNKAAHKLETLADDQHCHHDHTTQQNTEVRTANRNRCDETKLRTADYAEQLLDWYGIFWHWRFD